MEGLWRILFIIFLVISSIAIIIQIPFFQNKIVGFAADYISNKLHFPVTIGYIGINWAGDIELLDAVMKDPKGVKMIYIGNCSINFKALDLFKGELNIEEANLENGGVNLVAYENGNININDFIDALSSNDSLDTQTDTTQGNPFFVPKINLINMHFSYNDVVQASIKDFDHNHFEFDSIYGEVQNLFILGDTFKINVRNLNTIETHTRLKVHSLSTDYLITSYQMEFQNLDAHIGNSHVKKYLNFSFSDITNLAYFVDSTDVTLDLEQTRLDAQDLAFFNQELKPFYENAIISGKFKGKVGNFGVRNLKFGFGKNSILKGRLEIKGLPNIRETFIDFAFKESLIDSKDLFQYCDNFTYKQFQKFNKITGKGKFTGFANDFVASGVFETGLGDLITDINFKLDDKKHNHAYYKGKVKCESFHIGKLIEQESYLGKIKINGTIEGEGISIEDALVKVNANIYKLELNQYQYSNIYTNATLQDHLFDGEISVKDSNLIFDANGIVDFRQGKNIVKISGNIEKANLQPIHLSLNDKEVLLKTNFFFDFTGLELDKINGRAGLTNTYLLYKGIKEIHFNSLEISTFKTQNNRTLNIISDIISLDAKGNFDFSTIISDAERIVKEYNMSLASNPWEQQLYYASKTHQYKLPYQLDFNIHAKNINEILSIYVPNLYLSSGFFIKGDYNSGHRHLFHLTSFIDTLYYNENELVKTEFELNTSKSETNPEVLASLYLNSKSQKFKSGIRTKNLYLEGNWKNDSIDFKSKIYQQDSEDYLNLQGDIKLSDRTQTLILKNSELKILDKIWNFEPQHKLFFTKTTIAFENLKLQNNNQYISLNGEMSDYPEHQTQLEIRNFDLNNLNSIIKHTKFEGKLNANLTLKNVFSGFNALGNIQLDTFFVDGFKIGNVMGATSYDFSSNTIKVGVEVVRDDIKIINIVGDINNSDDNKLNKLNLTATLLNAELEVLNPIMDGVLSNISGKATGEFNITGTTRDISIKGQAAIKKGKFKIPYLGTTYYFEDNIYLTENMIGFKKLKIKDKDGNIGIINGGLYHDNFNHFIVDIKGNVDDLKILDLNEKQNKMFYGEAISTGKFEIFGNFNELQINANATTKKGTKIFIPINSSASTEKQSYIRFVDKKNKDLIIKKADSVDESGLKMEFNLEITPNAYTEIIFDKRTGDIIRGHGNGNINLKIDTRGDFTMEGDYRFTEGWYNFTLAGLINKEFKIKANSSINWSGDPYSGIMDITAEYSQFVSMRPLLKDSTALKNPEVSRKYPALVQLNLTGNLLTPEIKMGINILRNPSFMNDIITAFKAKLQANEQELNRQVFSVLVLGGLAPENSFSGISNSANNISEMLSNQLSNWLSQVDEKLQVDVNLNSLDRNALNTFQMRLSYTMMDGRLRVSRDGSFRNVQNSSTTNLSNIAGEWTVEYLISADGRFRLKLFNRSNQNILLNSAGGSATGSAGFSILHTQNFNNLRELFTNKENKVADKLEKYIKDADNKNEGINEENQKQTDSSDVTSRNRQKGLDTLKSIAK
ncbi:MAG: hypothetical protein EAZ07_04170 [Cytophagales bacterium]|nr:MAG: hypothetical protein EAZ07_04170 [Cytophagales bacterium]